jgi:UDPglucose 6-dehydrogenase
VLGLTFKAGTSDIRDSPSLAICAELQRTGAQVTAYDPRLESIDPAHVGVPTAGDPYVAVKDADAVLVLTEWPEFAELDWQSIGQRAASDAVILDTRNLLSIKTIDRSDLTYVGNGTATGY